MERKEPFAGVLLVTLMLVTATISATDQQSDRKSVVLMEITAPTTAAKDRAFRLTVLDGETGEVTIPELGRFGFTPKLNTDSDSTARMTVTDRRSEPARDLTTLTVSIGAEATKTDTDPAFLVRIVQVRKVASR